jgi:hypothetical protein
VARTAKNVFTTDYFYTWVDEPIAIAFPPEAKETPAGLVYDQPQAPPNAVSWAFDVTDTGATRVLAAFRRDELHPLQIAHVEAMLGGPLPDREFIWVPSAELPAGPAADRSQTERPPEPPVRDAVPFVDPGPPGLRHARQIF